MVDAELDKDDESAEELLLSMPSKKKDQLTDAMKRTSEWISSQEIPSDVNIHIGDASFTLHKFPLVSKCGYIRKVVSVASEDDLSDIDIPDIPGGVHGFELAAKFCYGINFEIGIDNIAMLRCVAEYLEMTEDYASGNLVGRTEAYLNEVATKSLAGAVSVLHLSEDFFPMAEKVKLISRCIDAVSDIVCKDNHDAHSSSFRSQPKPVVDWWAEHLTVLRIDIFQRILMAMIGKGFKQYAIGPVLMLYTQKSLRGLEILVRGRKKIDPKQEHDKRVVLETIVSLLPKEKNAMSVSFLSILLRSAIYLETTVACRLDLEKRMGLQLGQAVLDDLLIPSYSFTGDTLFDVDTVQRIMMNYFEYEMDDTRFDDDIEYVGKLMESYLAEIASDRNLTVSRFISLAELIPEDAKVTEDGMYRSIDIYIKAHPSLSDMEKKKVCSLMDCQKLSREACAHVAQNDRLPAQTVVQVLYYEQQRLQDVASANHTPAQSPAPSSKLINVYPAHFAAPADELSSLRKENNELKAELSKLKMRLTELEKPAPVPFSANRPPLPRKSLINSVSKKLGRLSSFVRSDEVKLFDVKARTKPSKDRRHSIS